MASFSFTLQYKLYKDILSRISAVKNNASYSEMRASKQNRTNLLMSIIAFIYCQVQNGRLPKQAVYGKQTTRNKT